MEKLTAQYKGLFVPAVSMVVFLVLIAVAGNFLLGQISSIREQSGLLNSKIETLEARVAALQNTSDTLKDSASVAAVAVPEQNPSVLVTRQLRKLASDKGVALSDFSVVSTNTQDANAMYTYEVKFQVSAADYAAVAAFLGEMDNLLPLVNLGSLAVDSRAATGTEAQVRLVAYSAAYPVSFPSLDEPLSGLSEEEQKLLNALGGFNAPEVGAKVPATTQATPRPNPFSPEI